MSQNGCTCGINYYSQCTLSANSLIIVVCFIETPSIYGFLSHTGFLVLIFTTFKNKSVSLWRTLYSNWLITFSYNQLWKLCLCSHGLGLEAPQDNFWSPWPRPCPRTSSPWSGPWSRIQSLWFWPWPWLWTPMSLALRALASNPPLLKVVNLTTYSVRGHAWHSLWVVCCTIVSWSMRGPAGHSLDTGLLLTNYYYHINCSTCIGY